ncbi:hypothetical protein Taro_051091 [Colocasia esculenta]|uniref:Uncharacterized protein n=1 Tax=Colocasia esculenta TaxID=4460 RepID=A0A843XF28_COLES|nr:hypothetical protein [Colocasia esculenta]
MSRHHRDGEGHRDSPCCDRARHRDSNPVTTQKHVATVILLRPGSAPRQPYRDCQLRRDKVAPEWADASSDVATHRAVATPVERQTNGILNPEPPTNHTITPQGVGEHGESSKANYKPRGHKKSLPFTKNRTHEGPSRRTTTSSSLHDAAPTLHHEPSAAPCPDRRRGASPSPEKRGKGRRGERGERGGRPAP